MRRGGYLRLTAGRLGGFAAFGAGVAVVLPTAPVMTLTSASDVVPPTFSIAPQQVYIGTVEIEVETQITGTSEQVYVARRALTPAEKIAASFAFAFPVAPAMTLTSAADVAPPTFTIVPGGNYAGLVEIEVETEVTATGNLAHATLRPLTPAEQAASSFAFAHA